MTETTLMPWAAGTILDVIRGGFAGQRLRVAESSYHNGESWQIVLQVESAGRWVDFCRESAAVVASMTAAPAAPKARATRSDFTEAEAAAAFELLAVELAKVELELIDGGRAKLDASEFMLMHLDTSRTPPRWGFKSRKTRNYVYLDSAGLFVPRTVHPFHRGEF